MIIEIFCQKCGDKLTGEILNDSIEVEPCENCINDAIAEVRGGGIKK